MEYFSVILKWGVVVFVGAIVVYVYKPEWTTRLLPSAQTTTQGSNAGPAKSAKKKQKAKNTRSVKEVAEQVVDQAIATATATASSNNSQKGKKRRITAPIDKKVIATTTNGQTKELPRVNENEVSDRDFAQQLAKAQAGTNLQAKSQQKGAAPTRLAAALQPQPSQEMLSTLEASSTTGQDADDDMSSGESPERRPASGNDISDMLEAPAAASTTLRLTNVAEAKKPKQTPKQFEQVLSKKKRNERARREEEKRLREESDRIHEQKKQEQLRRARMAEGSSNQTKANTFTSTSNAWQSKNPTPAQNQNGASGSSLLDTFEPSTTNAEAVQAVPLSDITSKGRAINGAGAAALKERVGDDKASALAASRREALAGNMSEEELTQRIQEQDETAWESVTSKKQKKKARSENDTSSEASFSVAPKTNGVKSNAVPKAKENTNVFEAIRASGLQDDDWQA